MRAAQYRGDRQLTVDERAPRAPGSGEVELEVAYTGICGTDLHIFHGAMDHRVTLPAVLGHEMSGVVNATGAGVERWAAGDRVTVMPLDWCGRCPACSAGHTHVCHQLNFLGIDSPGSLQERWVVPARALISLPDHLDLRVAALAEPTAVAVHDVSRADLEPGERVLVIGGGPIGILIALVARASGADVLLSEPNDARRALAASLGIATVDVGSGAPVAGVERWTGGAGVPVAFEVSGSVEGLDFAVQALGVRGRLVVVAIHPTAPPVDLFRMFWRELTLLGARVYTRSDFTEAVRLLASGDVPAEALITGVEPLDRAPQAFEAVEGGRAMKVLIACSAGSSDA